MRKFTIKIPLDFVQNVSCAWWRYIPIVFLIAFVPSTIFSALINVIFKPEASVEFGELTSGLVVSLVIIAPLIETLIMWPIIVAIRRFLSRRPVVIAGISALLWAGFHALQTPVWGLTVAWSFFVFSLCFISWKRVSTVKAIGFTVAIHALQNAVAVGYILLRIS